MLEGHNLNKHVLFSSKNTALYNNFSQQAIQRPVWPHVHSRDMVLMLLSLQYDLCSLDSCFCLHYSWNNTVYIPSRTKESKTGRHHLCFLSHNDKLTLILQKDELNYFPKKSVLTVSSPR